MVFPFFPVGVGVVVRGPAGAVTVVGGAFAWVGEDGVCGDDEAVALEVALSFCFCVLRGRGEGGAVWVVDLDEFVEAAFAVGVCGELVEDLVRSGDAAGIVEGGPLKVGGRIGSVGCVGAGGVGYSLGGLAGS